MSDGNDKRNRNAAFLAIIAVIILCILALFVTVRILRDTDLSSINLPFMSPAESPSPSGMMPSEEPLPSTNPSPSLDPLSGFNSVFFGQYQGNPIEWIILDSQGNRILLLSKRAVETLPYHSTDEPVFPPVMVKWRVSEDRVYSGREFFRSYDSSRQFRCKS